MASLLLPTTLLMSCVVITLASGVERRELVWSDEFNDEVECDLNLRSLR